MPWSIFRDGGGPAAAATWAGDLLSALGAPLSAGNLQFVYDWETSEGGGGRNNPLNQGPLPQHPELSGGTQYGGGASDYVSPAAGITGAVGYLHMGNYAGVLDALMANNPQQARAALIASPWAAGHYGGGSGFSSAPVPADASTGILLGFPDPVIGAVGGAVGGVIGGVVDVPARVVASLEADAAAFMTATFRPLLLKGLLVTGGVAMVVLAGWHATTPARQGLEAKGAKVAQTAAVVAA